MAERLRPSSSTDVLEPLCQAAVLDNQLSPTLNLNVLFAGLQLERQRNNAGCRRPVKNCSKAWRSKPKSRGSGIPFSCT